MTDHFTVLINFGPRNPAFDSDYTKYPTYFALHVEKGKTWFSFKMDHKVGASQYSPSSRPFLVFVFFFADNFFSS
jgi:hypothetical protein